VHGHSGTTYSHGIRGAYSAFASNLLAAEINLPQQILSLIILYRSVDPNIGSDDGA